MSPADCLLPGRCTAIVGPSGAGKSTLLRLLDRLTEPSSGRVLLRGRPLPSYDVLEVRRRIGLVQQAPVLLGETVLADLRTGRQHAHSTAIHLSWSREIFGDSGSASLQPANSYKPSYLVV